MPLAALAVAAALLQRRCAADRAQGPPPPAAFVGEHLVLSQTSAWRPGADGLLHEHIKEARERTIFDDGQQRFGGTVNEWVDGRHLRRLVDGESAIAEAVDAPTLLEYRGMADPDSWFETDPFISKDPMAEAVILQRAGGGSPDGDFFQPFDREFHRYADIADGDLGDLPLKPWKKPRKFRPGRLGPDGTRQLLARSVSRTVELSTIDGLQEAKETVTRCKEGECKSIERTLPLPQPARDGASPPDGVGAKTSALAGPLSRARSKHQRPGVLAKLKLLGAASVWRAEE